MGSTVWAQNWSVLDGKTGRVVARADGWDRIEYQPWQRICCAFLAQAVWINHGNYFEMDTHLPPLFLRCQWLAWDKIGRINGLLPLPILNGLVSNQKAARRDSITASAWKERPGTSGAEDR